MKKHLYTTFALLVILSSCTKEKTKDELLLGDWKMNALTADPPQVVNGVVITDWYAQLEDCDKDNYFTFNDNKTYKFDEGATNCDPLDPQNISGNWQFLNNETELRLIYQSDTVTYGLLELDEETLRMTYSGRDSSNILHTFTATFKHL